MIRTKSPAAAEDRFIPLVEPWLDDPCASEVGRQVASGFVGPGKTTENFAESLAAKLDVEHCILTTSGTTALSVAAHACGLKPGDEILVPSYGVISTVNAFASIGLLPRLVEIERTTACINPMQLKTRITSRTKAVCFVNFSGYTGENIEQIRDISREAGVPLIEDAATALGHCHAGKSAGTFGTVGTLSFSPPKTITTGQGGAILTNSREHADAARAYIDHGDLEWRKTNLNRAIGTNLRFNDVLAALGNAQLRTLDDRLDRRRQAYRALREVLGNLLYKVHGEQAPLFNIVFASDPDRLVDELRLRNIAAVRQYRSIYQHPPYADLADGGFPIADWWTNHAVYLPFGLALSQGDSRRIGTAVRDTKIDLLIPQDIA
ncbi:MAG: DegT/DnrJ/EryC1/StrS family aminotransferase [Vulcanimicrobiaceae bacterium]